MDPAHPRRKAPPVTVHPCSLILKEPQQIPTAEWKTIRFPYGTAESYDTHRMHQTVQPGGGKITDWRKDDRAGLIWPDIDGWGLITAMVQWEAGTYRQLGARFVRDPLGGSTGWDSTATDERCPTPGVQRATYMHQMFVRPGTPIALQVYHDDPKPRGVIFAEFKLSIHTTKEGS